MSISNINPKVPDDYRAGPALPPANEDPSRQVFLRFDAALHGHVPSMNIRASMSEAVIHRNLKTVPDSHVDPKTFSKAVASFRSQFAEHAETREGFHALLGKAFGNIDADTAEEIRLQVVDGDFSWMPEINVVSGDASIRGAYSAEEETVFLNQEVLADPAEALRVVTEEVGHHLQIQVRQGDSLGDEGAVFARMFLGEKLSPQALDALRYENDHGMVNVDGRDVAVEFDTVVFTNGGPFPGVETDLGGGQKSLHVDDIDVYGAGNAGVYINGRVVGPQDGFSDFRLQHVDGTHNNYTIIPGTTPYDVIAKVSGIDWQTLDKAWLDLTRQGNTDAAAQLRQGMLPPPDSIAPGPLQDQLREHYIRLARQTAEARGMSRAEVENAVASLFASDPITASKVLLNQGGLNIEAEVAKAHRGAQDRVFASAFDTPEQIEHLAHVYVAAGRLPEAQRDALRKSIGDRALESGKAPDLQVALDNARQAGIPEHVDHLTQSYISARETHADTTAVTELGQIAASASVHELRADADRLIREGGTQVAYDTLEARFRDEELAVLPEPFQQAMRVAVVGELGRVNALHVVATEGAPTLSGDATADAQLLREHKGNLAPLLSATTQDAGVGRTLLHSVAALDGQPSGPDRDALVTALDEAWQKLPEDIAFKHAERQNGTVVHLQELVAAQKQIRERHGDDSFITQSVERLIQNVDQNTTGTVGGVDVRIAPLIDYGQIEPLPDIPREDLWRYSSILSGRPSGLDTALPSGLDTARALPPDLLDLVSHPSPERIDYTDAAFRQRFGEAVPERPSNEVIASLSGQGRWADVIVGALEGKSAEEQREILATGVSTGAFTMKRPEAHSAFTGGILTLNPTIIGMAFGNAVANGVAPENLFSQSAIDYIVGAPDPTTQRTRVNEVFSTMKRISGISGAVVGARNLGNSRGLFVGPRGDSGRITWGPGNPIPFVESAVTRTVEYGKARGVLDEEVLHDTERAARGLVGWAEGDTDVSPARKVAVDTWSTVIATRIRQDEVGEFAGAQIATSLSYINRGETLGEQKTRAQEALRALVTTHKVGPPPVTEFDIKTDLTAIHPRLEEVQARHYDEIAPYLGLPQTEGEDTITLDYGDWKYKIKNDEEGNVVYAKVKHANDKSWQLIVAGVATIASLGAAAAAVAGASAAAVAAGTAGTLTTTSTVLAGTSAALNFGLGVGTGNWLQAGVGALGVVGAVAGPATTVGSLATSASYAIQTGASVKNAIDSGDGLAIAGAAFSAAGLASDGLGDLGIIDLPSLNDIGGISIGKISVGFRGGSATADLVRAVKEDELGLGLYAAGNLAGAYSASGLAGAKGFGQARNLLHLGGAVANGDPNAIANEAGDIVFGDRRLETSHDDRVEDDVHDLLEDPFASAFGSEDPSLDLTGVLDDEDFSFADSLDPANDIGLEIERPIEVYFLPETDEDDQTPPNSIAFEDSDNPFALDNEDGILVADGGGLLLGSTATALSEPAINLFRSAGLGAILSTPEAVAALAKGSGLAGFLYSPNLGAGEQVISDYDGDKDLRVVWDEDNTVGRVERRAGDGVWYLEDIALLKGYDGDSPQFEALGPEERARIFGATTTSPEQNLPPFENSGGFLIDEQDGFIIDGSKAEPPGIDVRTTPVDQGGAESLGIVSSIGDSGQTGEASSIGDVEAKNVSLSQTKIDEIISIPKGQRPDPNNYLSASYINNHLSQFADGSSRFMLKDNLDEFGLAHKDGTTFVMTKSEANKLIESTKGDKRQLEGALGLPEYFLEGNEFVRVDIPNPSELNIRIPSGNEAGAIDDLWIPGGKLPDGNLEAVIDVGDISPSKYTVTPFKF